MKRKWTAALTVLLGAALTLTACGGGKQQTTTGTSKDDGKTYTFKAGHSLTENHPYHLSLKQLKENVEKRTNGKVKIEVYPLSQLGAERELTEALSLGTADMSISSTAPIANFYPAIGVVDLPFLFGSREHATKVLDGKVGQDLLKGLEKSGIIGLAWGENGFRHITNSKKEIKSPEDLKGIKIRTQENKIHIAAFEALGAKPTPMAWTEALTALQQGVVEAQENPAIVADQYKLYESKQTFMSLTGHVYSPAVFMFSKSKWDTLPPDIQKIIAEEAKAAAKFEREQIAKMEEESLKKLKEKGVKIFENVDKKPFRDAIKPVYEKYESQFGKKLIEDIVNTK
ncbi:TRAP transporter substrate-binding protein [Effusibacillus lacus]|uniref:C4-dicarboxylate ABC transporter substrate-binding protein n=1 Tax=Effusibacillus lacus TaxID=1348429 RepID=A0A292YH99_9BACL|nr:TRAP transporter substrate-binding protein [Effusibacillus lacus]TCS68272.1 tripartite ATP-independent transporter DctP family solute receptor [Effusibacillus lacus]GAX90177.1 C4-dicarboxylate ABC transporter substrate-binding protein [Effusibacillus lacus]